MNRAPGLHFVAVRLNSLATLSLSLAWCGLFLAAPYAMAIEHGHVCRYCSGLEAATTPPTTNGRQYAPDRQVDVQHIKLDMTPDFDQRSVAGTATLKFAPISKPLKSLRLDAVRLKVSEVRASHEVRDYSTDDESITIVFKEEIPVGENAWVKIDYSAEPVQGLYFRTPAMGFPETDTHCWTQGEPHEARHWFPAFDYPNERASSEIVFHVPRDMTVVSNGRKVAEKEEEGDLKAVHWLQEKPHVSYLICVIAGHLEKLEDKHGEVPLGFYTQPSKAKYAKNAFLDTAKIMAFYEKETGVPYPWDKYDQCTCADYHWGGMENTTITTLTQRTINSDAVENVRTSRSLDAHELAHQWFGDYLTCKDWSHLWLNEGFATYYALLYEEEKFGRDDLLYGLYLDAQGDIFPASRDQRPIVYRAYGTPREQFDFRNYPKGSWVLHMLRSRLGADLYRQAIHTYLKRHALSNVETDDLREVFEELSGETLDKFFDQWVYHGGFPDLKISYKWLAEEKTAQVTIEQTQETNDKVLLFELDSKLRFVVDGKPIDEPVTIDGRRHDFYVKLPAEPTIVRFDPEYTLLARVAFDQSDKMLEAQLKDGDVIGRLMACESLGKRKTKGSVEALRQALSEDKFFGVRMAAAKALRQAGTEEAVAALIASCEQDDARVRHKVVEEIAACYGDAPREKLLAVAENEKNPAIVAAAIRGIGSYHGKQASEVVRKALGGEAHDESVGAAFAAARELGDRSLADEVMEAIKARESRLDPRDLSEGMGTLAKLSDRGRRQERAFEFLAEYLKHPRQTLQIAAIRALGTLRDSDARPLLEPIAATVGNPLLADAAKDALRSLDQESRLVPAEVEKLRGEVRQLRESQEKLQKKLDELSAKSKAKEASGDDRKEST